MTSSSGEDAPPAPSATRKPERPQSTFSVTCNLLSQFLKDRRAAGFGDLGLGIGTSDRVIGESFRTTPTTMSLLPGIDVSQNEDEETRKEEMKRNADLELFPQRAGFAPLAPTAPTEGNAGNPGRELQGKGQLTIIYGGKVLVFDDFTPDKAREIVQFAGRACEALQKQSYLYPAVNAIDHPNASLQQNSGSFPSTSGSGPVAAEQSSSLAQVIGSDMPIARRATLNRFLEKRKDRVIAKGPYQLNAAPLVQAAAAATAKPEENMQWHGFKS
ncbi:hypothetical protein J5N97_006848 [Dioscorea zingiberensis]|uniref:Protein TIFY n=1 Tax=Dioscorea zingiberensis TaxID=325984 RepID=A0A9D5DE44_9LILI|nr:hypothetical protein J5N97_006848 [Dioscorea zingiberensis]